MAEKSFMELVSSDDKVKIEVLGLQGISGVSGIKGFQGRSD